MIYNQKRSQTKYQKFQRSQYLPYLHPRFSTLAIHEGQQPQPNHGSINVPIYLSSTFKQKDINQFTSDFHYTRCGNPTKSAVEKCISKLQYGQYALAFSSLCAGMSSVFHLIKTGDHVICCDDVYIGMRRFIHHFTQNTYNIEVDYVNMRQIQNIKSKIKSNTTLIWLQTPVNPTCRLFDLEAIGKLGKQHNILTVVDNSFLGSYLQSPLLLEIDISLTSCSKYLGGHSDLIMGVLATNRKQIYEKLFVILQTQGVNPSPFDCYLVLRSLKTLQIRMERACENAYTLAHYLQNHPLVEVVYYAGLKSHPQHDLALKQMRGFGGVVSFDMKGGRTAIDAFIKALKIFKLAESFGGVQSLIQHPFYMSDHKSVPVSLLDLGVTEKLIRLAVGIECIDDIMLDVQTALQAATKAIYVQK